MLFFRMDGLLRNTDKRDAHSFTTRAVKKLRVKANCVYTVVWSLVDTVWDISGKLQ